MAQLETSFFLEVSGRPAYRPSCGPCCDSKKRCQWPARSSDEPCLRCAALGKACVPPEPGSTRRKREKARQAAKRNADRVGAPLLAIPLVSTPSMPNAPLAAGFAMPTPPLDVGSAVPPASANIPANGFGAMEPAQDAPKKTKKGTSSRSKGTKGGSPPTRLPTTPPPSATSSSGELMASPPLSTVVISHDFNELLLPCLEAYWTQCHPTSHLIHRETFEAAILSQTGSFVYGPRPPVALLYALAATGARVLVHPILADPAHRTACARAFLDHSSALILGGFLSQPIVELRSQTPLEALQTLIVLLDHAIAFPAYPVLPLLHQAVSLAVEVCVDRSDGCIVPSGREPQDPAQWAFGEMRARAWCSIATLDIALAGTEARPPLYNWTGHPLVIPCADPLFDVASALDAFSMLYGQASTSKPFAVDFSNPPESEVLPPAAVFLNMLGLRFGRGAVALPPPVAESPSSGSVATGASPEASVDSLSVDGYASHITRRITPPPSPALIAHILN